MAELKGSKLQHDPSKVIHNISSYQLSKVEQSLLCKRLNFGLQKLKFENHLLPFELLLTDIFDRNESLSKDTGLSSFKLYNKKDHGF